MGATVRDDEDCGSSERGEAGPTAASSPISLAPPTSFPRSLASQAHHPLFACPHRLQRRDPPLLPRLVRWPPSFFFSSFFAFIVIVMRSFPGDGILLLTPSPNHGDFHAMWMGLG